MPGLTVIGNGSTIVLASAHTVFAPQAPNINFIGFACEMCGTFFEPWADACTIENCQLGMNPATPPASIGQVFVPRGTATNATCRDITAGITATVSYYMQLDGATLKNCTGLGSVGEATVRTDSPDGITIPKNMLIVGGSFSRNGNKTGKQTAEFREGSTTISGGTIFNGDTVTGQGTPSSPPEKPGELGTLTIVNAVFQNRTAGNPFMSIRYGSKTLISILNVKFIDPAPPSQTVVVSGGSLTWL